MYISSANGVTGILIRSNNTLYLRVYSDDKQSFIDYEIWHSDLQVTINDVDAMFYNKDGRLVLDHSPDTLGIISK